MAAGECYSSISMVARWSPSRCSKSYDLRLAFAPCDTWSSWCTALRRVGVTASKVDLPSLMPLAVAVCGRLQLGIPHWATSVALLQVVDNGAHIFW